MPVDDGGVEKAEYGAKYEGRLSNSAVQTMQFCTHRFKRLYAGASVPDGASPAAVSVDSRSLGVLVHSALERVLEGDSVVLATFFDEAATMTGLVPEDLRRMAMRHASAADATQASGARYGTTYSAPEMTNYWKKNFTDVDLEWARLQAASDALVAEGACPISWQIPLSELVGVGYACVQAELRSRCWSPPEPMRRVSLEQVIFGDVFGVSMAGTLDVLVNFDSPAEDREKITVIDYKTGRKRWTMADIQNSDQFCLYTHMIRAKYPEAEIKVGVRDLRHDEYLEVPVDAVAMAAWENRYEPKVLLAARCLELGAEAEEAIIPYGSGFHPSCPCEFTTSCPYTPDF